MIRPALAVRGGLLGGMFAPGRGDAKAADRLGRFRFIQDVVRPGD